LPPLVITHVKIDRRPDDRWGVRSRHRLMYYAQAFSANRRRHWAEWGERYGDVARLILDWARDEMVTFSDEARAVLHHDPIRHGTRRPKKRKPRFRLVS
jgi:hypothetical protein